MDQTYTCSYKLESTTGMHDISREEETSSDSHWIVSYHSIFQALSNSLLGKFLHFNNEKQPNYLVQDECQSGAGWEPWEEADKNLNISIGLNADQLATHF